MKEVFVIGFMGLHNKEFYSERALNTVDKFSLRPVGDATEFESYSKAMEELQKLPHTGRRFFIEKYLVKE